MEKGKKALVITIIVLFVLIILFALWWFFVRSPGNGSGGTNEDPQQNTFFPITNGNKDNIIDNNDEFPTNSNEYIPALRQISNTPTAGFITFLREASSTLELTEEGSEVATTTEETVYRYIERATGHLFETTENTLTQKRLSNVTIPKVYDALFTDDGDTVVMRSLNDDDRIDTFIADLVLDIGTTTEEGSDNSERSVLESKLQGIYLGTEAVQAKKFGNDLIYQFNTNSGQTNIVNLDLITGNALSLFSSSISEWLYQKVSDNILALNTKPDSRSDGFLYFYNTQTGDQEKMVGNIKGLTSLVSPDGKHVVYSEGTGVGINTYVLNTETNSTRRLNIKTLPEKCVFSRVNENTIYCATPNLIPNQGYPQSWYQGKVSFEDNIWEIDLENDFYDIILLADRDTEGQVFDIIKPQLSDGDEYIIFINKNDLTLWSFDLYSVGI